MSVFTFRKILTLFLVSLTLTHCTESQNINSSNNSDSDNPDGHFESDIVGNSITEIDLNAENLSFSLSLEPGEEAVLLMVSHDDSGEAHGFQIVNSESFTQAGLALASPSLAESAPNQTEDIHEILRLSEEDFITAERIESPSAGFAFSAQAQDEKTFKVIQSFSDTSDITTINSILIYEGDYIHFYIDERDYNSITSDQLNLMIEKAVHFDEETASKEVEMFGEPSDVDQNGVMHVVATREVNNYYDLIGAFVTGYFYAGDTFDVSINSGSNEAEVVFVIVPDASGVHGTTVSDTLYFENILEGVIAHEYQHCVNFNQRYMVNNASIELPALNEFLSHLSEDLLNNMESSGIENYSRVSSCLADLQNIDIFGGTSLSQRGCGYLFTRYIYEQADKGRFENAPSGADFVDGLMQSPFRGVDNIKWVLFGDITADDEFADLFSSFALAIYLSDTELSDGDLFQIEGINLRAISNDNRGTYLNGPPLMGMGNNTFTGVLDGVSMAFVQIESIDIQNASTLFLNADDTSNLKAYLIQ